jgi:hypothetical protein
MARGGARPGAGRPPTPAKPPQPGTKVAYTGVDPLEYMLGILNDPSADQARRDMMAIACAPYLHPPAKREIDRRPETAFLPRGVYFEK